MIRVIGNVFDKEGFGIEKLVVGEESGEKGEEEMKGGFWGGVRERM